MFIGRKETFSDSFPAFGIISKTLEAFFISKFSKICAINFVLGAIVSKPLMIFISLSLSLEESAEKSARVFIFFEMLKDKSRGVGPKTRHPPTKIGALLEPCLALPVPFCCQTFLVVLLTSPRSFVLDVPCL